MLIAIAAPILSALFMFRAKRIFQGIRAKTKSMAAEYATSFSSGQFPARHYARTLQMTKDEKWEREERTYPRRGCEP